MDLSIAQQTDGEAPFFNDSGSLSLPSDNTVEMQEAMPETLLFPTQHPDHSTPQLGSPLDSPGI
jgi:hypothetical protein